MKTEYRKKDRKGWWGKYKSTFTIVLAVIVCLVAGTWFGKSDNKTTETANETLTETKAESQNEAKFNENKKKGDDYYLLLVGSPNNKNYKDQAKYYYGLALQYKEDAVVRNRFEKLKK